MSDVLTAVVILIAFACGLTIVFLGALYLLWNLWAAGVATIKWFPRSRVRQSLQRAGQARRDGYADLERISLQSKAELLAALRQEEAAALQTNQRVSDVVDAYVRAARDGLRS